MSHKYKGVNTFEVSLLSGGTVTATKDKGKAEEVFNGLVEAMPNVRVYFQVWNGKKLVSERIGFNGEVR